MQRREFFAAAGVAALASVAGCLGGDSDDGSEDPGEQSEVE